MIYRKKQYLGDEEEKLSADIIYGDKKYTQTQINEQLLSQIPTYTPTPATSLNIQDSSNLPIKDFQLLGNASQDGTPTPDSPVPISVVTGDNTLTFSETYAPMEQGTLIANGSEYANTKRIRSDFIEIPSYTSFVVSSNHFNYKCSGLYFYDSTQTFISNSTSDSGYDMPHTFDSIPSNAKYFRAVFQNSDNTTEINPTDKYLVVNPQTQLISLGDIELVKKEDDQDRIYKSEDKWYLEKNISKYILNGDVNEMWTVQASGTSSWFYQHQIGQSGRKKAGTTLLSNYYEYTSSITTSNTTIGINNMNISSSAGAIRIRYGTEDTVDNYKTWLSTHNLIAYMVPETPTTTEITDTTLIQQLENVLAMTTYKNETNAFSIVASGNVEGELQIEYYQDIGTLINDLRTAILGLGNI